jgi:hypothetical protein
MGIALETSKRGVAAAVVADAVSDHARQDECHARDADHVRRVLRDECLVCMVIDGSEVDDDVKRAARGHQHEAEEHHERDSTKAASGFYREHALEIHRTKRSVKCIAQFRM